MSNKTKEILDRLKYIVFNEIIDYGEELSLSECKLLLDYITNLQTIEQQYSAILSENAELENRIKELEQINEEHRELNGELREENNKLKKLIITLQKNIMKLDCSDEELELLNSILQGSDE